MAASTLGSTTVASDDPDPFEDIVFVEDRIYNEGYKSGYSDGTERGHVEGFESGYEKGSQIGEEIGFYLGFSETWLTLIKNDKTDGKDKVLRLLRDFTSALLSFQLFNFHDHLYFNEIDKLRSKYKQINSLLKISTEYQKKTSLNF